MLKTYLPRRVQHECLDRDVLGRDCHRSIGGQRAKMLREVGDTLTISDQILIGGQLPEALQSKIL